MRETDADGSFSEPSVLLPLANRTNGAPAFAAGARARARATAGEGGGPWVISNVTCMKTWR